MTRAVLPVDLETDPGGRIHFSGAGRSLIEEDVLELTSVGIDIGSSTSHLLVSTITLERMDTRYVVTGREVRFQSEILLTPYAAENTIDAAALERFIAAQYAAAGIGAEDIDTGALILTGVAARRANARAIGEIFAAEAGRFVAVSAGDALETLMAAHGSGAVALSESREVLNVDVGGGTTKIALCRGGEVVARTAVDAGARLVVLEGDRVVRTEPFGARHLAAAGRNAETLDAEGRRAVAAQMAQAILTAAQGDEAEGFMRLPPLGVRPEAPVLVFSGGVSEYLGGGSGRADDLGPDLARALREMTAGRPVAAARQGIRATVVGASQYTVQVSGSTIFLDPEDALPLRNLAVIAPVLDLGDEIDPAAVAAAVAEAMARLDLGDGRTPVATALPWSGSATYARLAALARGLVDGLRPVLDAGHPLVLVTDGDIGGLLGMQARAEEDVAGAIVSIDGIAARGIRLHRHRRGAARHRRHACRGQVAAVSGGVMAQGLDKPPPPRTITSVWPALVLLVLAAAMFLWSRTYGATAAQFPSIVAGVMVVLCLFDAWSRTGLPGARTIETFGGTGFRRREMDHDPSLGRQLALVAWIAGCFVAMAVVGLLAAAPLFCAAFVALHGRRRIAVAALVGLIVFVFQFAVFEWLLDYDLYRGLPFSRGGIAAW